METCILKNFVYAAFVLKRSREEQRDEKELARKTEQKSGDEEELTKGKKQ